MFLRSSAKAAEFIRRGKSEMISYSRRKRPAQRNGQIVASSSKVAKASSPEATPGPESKRKPVACDEGEPVLVDLDTEDEGEKGDDGDGVAHAIEPEDLTEEGEDQEVEEGLKG